jgi:MYXO-CTERM domain-containing protein
VDLLLLNFTGGLDKQVLETVTMGWRYGDSDFQVLRWAGAGAVTSISGVKATDLISTGWELVKTVAGANQSSQTSSTSNSRTYSLAEINPDAKSSSSWIISAYNSAFGAASPSGYAIDAMKVLGITASGPTMSVSAPGTFALAGLGLFAAAAVRRRRG